MSFKKVVILGGGPVGLLCAIEARQNFARDVTVVEKRSGYSRSNVPVLDTDIIRHLKKLDVQEKAGLGKDALASTSFSSIEKALQEKAEGMGIRVLRPYVTSSITGCSMMKHGRYKNMAMFLAKWDDKRKAKDLSGSTLRIEADLLIVATGGAAVADPIVIDTLGFGYEKLKAKNYGAYGIFNQSTSAKSKVPAAMKASKEIADFTIALSTKDHNYLLSTLSGITKEDFRILQGSTEKLKELLTTLAATSYADILSDLQNVQKNVGIFKIAIQRARQFYSPQFPAVLVGDAAVTPHPQTGSGYTTGFRGYEELCKLFAALKKTHRTKDNSVVFQSFNDRYELHVSRKALEGTTQILTNISKMLTSYAAGIRRDMPRLTTPAARDFAENYALTADRLVKELAEQATLARAYSAYLKPDAGEEVPEFEWDQTVRRLWEWIESTWKDVKALTGQVASLDERLASVQVALKPISAV